MISINFLSNYVFLAENRSSRLSVGGFFPLTFHVAKKIVNVNSVVNWAYLLRSSCLTNISIAILETYLLFEFIFPIVSLSFLESMSELNVYCSSTTTFFPSSPEDLSVVYLI